MKETICPFDPTKACVARECPFFDSNSRAQRGFRSIQGLPEEIVQQQIAALLPRQRHANEALIRVRNMENNVLRQGRYATKPELKCPNSK